MSAPDSVGTTTRTFGASLVILAAGTITSILLARELGPAGSGDLATIRTIPSLIATVALIGMPQAIIYSAARFKKRAATFAATGAVVALVATLMSAACGAMVLPHLLDGHSDQVVFAAQVFLLIGPIYAVIMVIEPMRSVGRTATWNALRIIPAGLWTLVVVVSSLLGQPTAEEFSYLQLIVLGTSAIPFLLIAVRLLPGAWRFSRKVARPLTKFGLPAAMADLPTLLNSGVALVLLSVLASSNEIGLFAVATAMAGLIGPLLITVGQVAFPRIASEVSRDDGIRTSERIARVGLPLVVCATAASVLFLPRLIEPVFGSGFAEASLPCAILCVSVGMTAYNYNLEQAFRALADQGPVIAAELLGAVVSAVLVVVLFAHFGIVGAAIGTVTGSISTSGTLIGLWVQRFNRPIAELVIPRRAELLLWAGRLRRSWRE